MSAAITAVAIGLISAGVGATAAIQQGQTARTTADMNADALKNSAISAENVAAQKAADTKMKAKRLEASQVAAAGAGGVDPTTGTPLTLVGQTEEFSELDQLRIINNASRTAWGLQTQASIDEFAGQQAQNASYLTAGSTLLGAVSSAYFSAPKGGGGGGAPPLGAGPGMSTQGG